MRKAVASLFALLVVLAIPPPAAWADSVPLGPLNANWLQVVAINNVGTGPATWNEPEAQFHGGNFIAGFALNGGSWTFSANNNLILAGPTLRASTLYLGLVMLPYTQPSYVEILQSKNGTLLHGVSTRSTWKGKHWRATHQGATAVPEPPTWLLFLISASVGGVLRKWLA